MTDNQPRNQLSASRLELAATCPGSYAHDHVETTSEAAERGAAVHAYIAGLLENEWASLPKDEKAAALCKSLNDQELMEAARPRHSATLYAEQALYLLPASDEAGLLEGEHHRDYSGAPEGAVVGTADAIAVEDDAVIVTDWKTGKSEIPHPAENYQLRFLGLVAARSFGKKTATVQIGAIRTDSSLELRSHTLEAEDLDAVENELVRVARSVEAARDGQPVYREGSHCRYCPAIANCPAISGAAQSILDGPPEEMTPKLAAETWSQLQAVEAAAKRVRESLQEYVYGREVPTAEGKVLKVVETRRENIDSEEAFPILRSHLPDETLARIVSFTKTSLSRELGKEASGDAMDAFRRAGAVTDSYSESLREQRR